MGALGEMSWTALRPVGELIDPAPSPQSFNWPEGYRVAFMDSGTTALAVALKATLGSADPMDRGVLLPAYTCPDVLSAIAWAGGRPLLVETRRDTPWLDDEEVAGALGPSVAAVVAPHFMGIPHPLARLSGSCRAAGVTLIEDSAQLGPISSAFQPTADLVVLSFGRGKPAPAGGGALLYRAEIEHAVGDLLEALPRPRSGTLGWRTRMIAQNAAMTRPGFGLARRLPGLAIGETCFKALAEPERLPPAWARQVESVLATWNRRSGSVAELVTQAERAGVCPIASALGWDGRSPLLRLPILANSQSQRDRVVAVLEREGLGASALYRDILPKIPGVPPCDQVSSLANAEHFAARLFTLPCHSGVTPRDVEAIGRCLRDTA
jgi:dTDP-4-amino-4,6-dideoxygalactose transaminase